MACAQARVALSGGHGGRECRVELDTGAEHHHVALERGKAERSAERRQRAGRGIGLGRRLVELARLAVGVPAQRLAEARQLRDEPALVRGLPVRELRRRGQIVTRGPKVGLAGSRSSGLAAPSTWTRTK